MGLSYQGTILQLLHAAKPVGLPIQSSKGECQDYKSTMWVQDCNRPLTCQGFRGFSSVAASKA